MNDEPTGSETLETDVEWRAVWPQRFDPKYVVVALMCAVCAGVGSVYTWFEASGAGVIGYTGFVGVCLGLIWITVRQAGLRWIRPSRKVIRCVHSDFGEGVRIGPESLALRVLIATLGGVAIYYGAVVAAFFLGHESLLPELRAVLPNTIFAGVCCVVLSAITLLLSVCRPSTGIELYQAVVIRTVGKSRIVRIGSDMALHWDSITDVADEVRLNHVGLWTTREPLIRLMTNGSVPAEGRLGWDTNDFLQLPVSWMAAEPNTILAVLRAMVGSAERRRKILSQDPRAVFTPPPLSARLRAPRSS